jgi:hypothetical protein
VSFPTYVRHAWITRSRARTRAEDRKHAWRTRGIQEYMEYPDRAGMAWGDQPERRRAKGNRITALSASLLEQRLPPPPAWERVDVVHEIGEDEIEPL